MGSAIEASYAGALSFMRRKYTRNLKGVDVAISGIPFDQAVTNRPGTRFGPQAIRAASAQHSWGPVWPWRFDPFETLPWPTMATASSTGAASRTCPA
jgi:agmatinase